MAIEREREREKCGEYIVRFYFELLWSLFVLVCVYIEDIKMMMIMIKV